MSWLSVFGLTAAAARHVSRRLVSSYRAVNEPIMEYGPDSLERHQVLAAVQKYSSDLADVPIVIGDEEIRTGDVRFQVEPFDHGKRIAKYYYADKKTIQKAIDSGLKARKDWDLTPLGRRAEVFLKAADLLAKEYRMDIVATTMLGQGKTIFQAEIDAACELIDFLRFNVQFALELSTFKPISTDVSTNSVKYRGMEGFWAAISPFNFTAIGGNLSSAPALMGNSVLWKPSDTAILSNYTVYKIFREAGLPGGVINFVPADGPTFGSTVTSSPHLVGVNFTGSVKTFKWLWQAVGENISTYKTYPRLIGECGGKNFHLVHPSADVESVINGTILSGFEYSGQKCSACSRAYIPKSIWPEVRRGLLDITEKLKVSSPSEVDTFTSAIIDDKAFSRVKAYLNHAKSSPNLRVLIGGGCSDEKGYFVEPTIIETSDPEDKIMNEEIFGPVVTVYPYEDGDFDKVVDLVDRTSDFGLTGAIFSKDRSVIESVSNRLRHATGNFYINDKSTGSVVGQQPFGGARNSGTNDKAGGPHYLLKFSSVQTIKETKVGLRSWNYPSMKL